MILVLGGTEDSRQIAKELMDDNHQIALSVTTQYGKEVAEGNSIAGVFVDSFDKDTFRQYLLAHNVNIVVDATHPYAAKITALAQEVCASLGLSYVRYERPSTARYADPNIYYVTDFEQAVVKASSLKGAWLFTTGSKELDKLAASKLLPLSQAYVRVLPEPSVLQRCYSLGFRASNIIAIQGPFSQEFNGAMLKDYAIKTLITKDSGDIGGTDSKIAAALSLGVAVIIIERPIISLEKGTSIQDLNQLKIEINKIIRGN